MGSVLKCPDPSNSRCQRAIRAIFSVEFKFFNMHRDVFDRVADSQGLLRVRFYVCLRIEFVLNLLAQIA